ncbi:MAG: thiamine diphosphokinase, partial [Actinomycetota bacterium]
NLIWVMPAEGCLRHDSVFVISGGPPASLPLPGLTAGALVIAADSGVDHALAAGIEIDVAIGDMDSISAAGLATVEAAGTRIIRLAENKDATDLEFALDQAVALEPRRIVVVSGGGGRLDHLLAELLLLGAERYAACEVDALFGSAAAHVIRSKRLLTGRRGAMISLLALHGPAEGVVTSGLVYALEGETLLPGSTRGVSNVFAEVEAHVELESGVLVALCPLDEKGAL